MSIYIYLKRESLRRWGCHLSPKWVRNWDMRGVFAGLKWGETAKKHKKEEQGYQGADFTECTICWGLHMLLERRSFLFPHQNLSVLRMPVLEWRRGVSLCFLLMHLFLPLAYSEGHAHLTASSICPFSISRQKEQMHQKEMENFLHLSIAVLDTSRYKFKKICPCAVCVWVGSHHPQHCLKGYAWVR